MKNENVEALRELTDLLMGAVPVELVDFFRPSQATSTPSMGQPFKILYDSLAPEQREALRDKDRKLLFTDLTPDQQVYLKQVFHQMWIWQIANTMASSPFYTSALEECRFFFSGEPGDMQAGMTVRREDPQPEDIGISLTFGV